MRICEGLEWMGLKIDADRNTALVGGDTLQELHAGVSKAHPCGAILTFASIVMFLPLITVAVRKGPGPMILWAMLFLAGILWMLYYKLFGDDYEPVAKQNQEVNRTPQNAYLPPPASGSTTDPAGQKSVVENTTRSLGRQ